MDKRRWLRDFIFAPLSVGVILLSISYSYSYITKEKKSVYCNIDDPYKLIEITDLLEKANMSVKLEHKTTSKNTIQPKSIPSKPGASPPVEWLTLTVSWDAKELYIYRMALN